MKRYPLAFAVFVLVSGVSLGILRWLGDREPVAGETSPAASSPVEAVLERNFDDEALQRFRAAFDDPLAGFVAEGEDLVPVEVTPPELPTMPPSDPVAFADQPSASQERLWAITVEEFAPFRDTAVRDPRSPENLETRDRLAARRLMRLEDFSRRAPTGAAVPGQ